MLAAANRVNLLQLGAAALTVPAALALGLLNLSGTFFAPSRWAVPLGICFLAYAGLQAINMRYRWRGLGPDQRQDGAILIAASVATIGMMVRTIFELQFLKSGPAFFPFLPLAWIFATACMVVSLVFLNRGKAPLWSWPLVLGGAISLAVSIRLYTIGPAYHECPWLWLPTITWSFALPFVYANVILMAVTIFSSRAFQPKSWTLTWLVVLAMACVVGIYGNASMNRVLQSGVIDCQSRFNLF